MPEEAYDLFSGQYVQVATEEEEAAASYEAMLDTMFARMRMAFADFVKTAVFVELAPKPVKLIYYTYDEIQDFKDWTPRPPKLGSWAEFHGIDMKSIYKHELPAREKFRGRAWQANQPGDQPWKGKRK